MFTVLLTCEQNSLLSYLQRTGPKLLNGSVYAQNP